MTREGSSRQSWRARKQWQPVRHVSMGKALRSDGLHTPRVRLSGHQLDAKWISSPGQRLNARPAWDASFPHRVLISAPSIYQTRRQTTAKLTGTSFSGAHLGFAAI